MTPHFFFVFNRLMTELSTRSEQKWFFLMRRSRRSTALPLPAFGALPPLRVLSTEQTKIGLKKKQWVAAAAALRWPRRSAHGGDDGPTDRRNHDLRSNRPGAVSFLFLVTDDRMSFRMQQCNRGYSPPLSSSPLSFFTSADVRQWNLILSLRLPLQPAGRDMSFG